MSNLAPVAIAYGDGIGPEIMAASLHIIKSAGARIQTEVIEIVKTENLGTFDGKPGYTLAQGQ
jgi:isocitrate/isopropylmalate dehydrogenase